MDLRNLIQPKDIVKHGGYSYTALTVNTNSVPPLNGITQNTGDWELLTTGYRMGGSYTPTDLADEYLLGYSTTILHR